MSTIQSHRGILSAEAPSSQVNLTSVRLTKLTSMYTKGKKMIRLSTIYCPKLVLDIPNLPILKNQKQFHQTHTTSIIVVQVKREITVLSTLHLPRISLLDHVETGRSWASCL